MDDAWLKDGARACGRLLTFRSREDELSALGWRHLAFGLLCTWLVGMGRYWDDPRAELLQQFGVGSVVYVFALGTFLWLLLWPLRPKRWAWLRVVTFVSLVSPPAALYAIPVERFLALEDARSANLWFLAAVAAWRVALLLFFLRRSARLDWIEIPVAGLLPLTAIVVALRALNLEHVVFRIMAGVAPAERSANDHAYLVVFLLSLFASLAAPVLVIGYVALIVRARRVFEDVPESQDGGPGEKPA